MSRRLQPRQVALAALVVAFASCEPAYESPTAPARPGATPAVKHIAPLPLPAPKKASEEPTVIVYTQRWKTARIKPAWQISADKTVMRYISTQRRYETVERMRGNGVPAPVIFALHYRESSNSFTAHLHEGSSLTARTRYVPKGRLPAPAKPPFTWEQSAEDAIYVVDKLQGDWRNVATDLGRIEGYNGFGYRKLGVPSPYLWAGTTVYDRGKYTSDGHYSSTAVDQQLGCAAILLRMHEHGIALPF